MATPIWPLEGVAIDSTGEMVASSVAAEIVAISTIVAAELTWQESGGTLTADGAEQNVYLVNAPTEAFYPHVVYIDLDLMDDGDTTNIREYVRIEDGGGWLLQDFMQYVGADGGLAGGRVLIAVEMLPNRFGARVTLEQVAGTNRDYTWSAVEES